MLTSQRLKAEQNRDLRWKKQLYNVLWIAHLLVSKTKRCKVWQIANCVLKSLLPILAEHLAIQENFIFSPLLQLEETNRLWSRMACATFGSCVWNNWYRYYQIISSFPSSENYENRLVTLNPEMEAMCWECRSHLNSPDHSYLSNKVRDKFPSDLN